MLAECRFVAEGAIAYGNEGLALKTLGVKVLAQFAHGTCCISAQMLATSPAIFRSTIYLQSTLKRLKLCGQHVRVNAIQRSGLGMESVRSEGFFWELAELRWMQRGTKTKVLAKTRYQRPPLFWVDTIGLTGNDKALMNVYSDNPHFDRYGRKRPTGIVFAKWSNVLDNCFELHRALFCPWRFDQVGCNGCQAGNFKLIRLIAITHLFLVARNWIAARQARRSSTAPTSCADGRFNTHWRSRSRFIVVFELTSRPRTQLPPSHHTQDIGARFGEPSSFVVPAKTTGVPK